MPIMDGIADASGKVLSRRPEMHMVSGFKMPSFTALRKHNFRLTLDI